MKYAILLTLLVGIFIPPTANSQRPTVSTYAVVVGISDYQDEGIPDLRFADKDALAFAGFLQSPAGGSLDEDHLKVLINEKATVAQFAIALDWLWEVVKEDDRVLIYFSGHGDVERKSLTQPGYLLCWDAPSKIYLAGGALALPMFQDVVSTLSVQNKAKVVVIMDACRSGKLSGSNVGGAQLTNSNLAKQYANEIKILSCQPDEYSIEGEQWGGGRGAFSYHLLDGLVGLADNNEDMSVNLREIRSYLEENVSEEVAPQSQLPMVVGNGREKLTDVFPEVLKELKEGKKGQLQLFTATASRGIEDDVLAAVDSTVVEQYFAFKKALEDKQFLFVEAGRAENDYAEFYYKKLSKEPSLKKLHSSMRRNYAAALQDDAQQVMNDWMKTSQDQNLEAVSGEKKGRLPIKVFTEKVRAFPLCLERAAELLGAEHYMYTTLQARKHFFKGYLLTNSDRNPNKEFGKKALAQFRQALEWQPELPQAYWQMSMVYGYNFLQPDSAEVYAQKAMALYPSWVMPYTDLAFLFFEKYKAFDRAKPYLEKATQIDSSSVDVWSDWGHYFDLQNEFTKAEKYFKKIIQIDSTNTNTYSDLGITYRRSSRYIEAENCLKKAIQLDSTNTKAYNNLGNVYGQTRRFDEAEKCFRKAIQLDSINTGAYNNLGLVYYHTRRYDEAEKYYKKVIQLDSTYTGAYNNLGNIYGDTRRYDKSEKYLKKAIQIDSTYAFAYNNLGNVYNYTHRYDKAEKSFKKAIHLDSTLALAYDGLGSVYRGTHRYPEAEKYYKKAIQLDSMFWFPYANLSVLYQSLQRWEESAAMTQKAIKYGPPIGELIAMLGNAYTHLPSRLEEAKTTLDKGLKMSPDNPYAFIYLAQWSLKKNQAEQAWQYLKQAFEKGVGNGQLTVEDLQEEPDFEEMQKDARWDELMKKYFPKQNKK